MLPSGCVWKGQAVSHHAENLPLLHLQPGSRVWRVPAGACLPDTPRGLCVGQTLHLDTNKRSEGPQLLGLFLDCGFIGFSQEWGDHRRVSSDTTVGLGGLPLLSRLDKDQESDLGRTDHICHEEGASPVM